MALATVQEFANHMQTTVTNSAAKSALDIATAQIQGACGQQFVYVVDDDVTLPGGTEKLVLPGAPVISISSVTTWDYTDLVGIPQAVDGAWIRSGATLIWRGGLSRLNSSPALPYFGNVWPYYVRVVYTHGYATIPDDVKGCCLLLAAEIYTSPSGAHYESIDDFAWRRGDADKTPGAQALKALKARYGCGIHSLRSTARWTYA
jgi:hypothetical protein